MAFKSKDPNKKQLVQQIHSRLTSIRACRLLVAQVVKEAYAGDRKATDIPKFVTGAQALSTLIMAENILKRGDGDIPVEDGRLGLRPGHYTEVQKKVRQGQDRYGMPIDETTVSRTGGLSVPLVLAPEEAEALAALESAEPESSEESA